MTPGGPNQVVADYIGWSSENVIVLTQACDLEHGKVEHVVISPHYSLTDYRATWAEWSQASGQNPTEKSWLRLCGAIAAGTIWNLTFLDRFPFDGHSHSVRVVDFHSILTMPRRLLEEQLRSSGKARPRLRPPYCEYLSQAFARYFMRVGLPQAVTPEWEAKKA